ncbi:MAG TPA: hypothetical protein VG815_10090 [Chloroflexota bacterium]|jgi:hypothetical protein|nr:hypothetical protein [Chloroflexota bacterium]
MNRPLIAFRVLAISVALLVMSLVQPLAFAGGHISHPAARVQQTGPATLVFSHNGKPLGVDHFQCGPNQACTTVELDWKAGHCANGSTAEDPPVVVVFTTAGQNDGRPAVAPCVKVKTAAHRARSAAVAGTNDVEYTPSAPGTNGTQTITDGWWTRNGIMTARILPPQLILMARTAGNSAPDAIHVFLNYTPTERLLRVKLRNRSKVVSTIKVPTGTNEVDWYGFTPQTIPFRTHPKL